MNLKKRVKKRLDKIPMDFNNEEKTIALESIYDDFQKEGFDNITIALNINLIILDRIKMRYKQLNNCKES